MHKALHHWLNSLTRYSLLRGHGWHVRTVSTTRTREWRDPMSGLWYSERQAMAILKDQALALYDREGQPRRPYSLRC